MARAGPGIRVRPVGMHEAKWTEGFWADKLERCRTGMLPSIERALLDPRNSEQLANFRVAAGLENGAYCGTDWSDGDCHKWLEAVSLVYAATRDPRLDRLLDEWVAVIARAQRPDGFLSTNAQLRPDRKPLDLPHTHQLYNMGHLLTAACVHHEATGKESYLRVARKAADFLHSEFGPRPPRLVHFPWNPSAYMGLVDLYRATGERRYLDLAKTLIDNRGSSPGGGDHRNGGTDQTQDRVPLREETQAVGHAVCAMYLYCGAADLYAETGEKALLDALERIWANIASRRSYVTGAVGVGSGQSPRGDPVHEAFLADYELPSRSAYAETCANIGHAMWNWRMLCITGEARYADAMERVLYNSLLSAVSADGTAFFYCNPLRWTGEADGPTRHHTATRWAVHRCYCCPPQVARTVAGLQRWAYGVSDEGVWVHLYGGSALHARLPDGSAVRLTQQTDYPWDGWVRIAVAEAPARELALTLRIPAWAEGAQVKVNGAAVSEPVRAGAYLAVRRRWVAGDVAEVVLPLEVRLLEAHPAVKELRNHVAVMRGPVVYCLELPKGDGGEEAWRRGVFLPENAQLTPTPGEEKGTFSFSAQQPSAPQGGEKVNVPFSSPVLTGTALTFEGRDGFISKAPPPDPAKAAEDWGDQLYRTMRGRPLPPPQGGTVGVALIPYFMWANRGPSFMEVWIPLAR